jgi:uncharacterized membrane protein YhaH (DUF805 family)
MNLIESVKSCFQKIITFSGRASRSEFWWFSLFSVLLSAIISSIAGTDPGPGKIAFRFLIDFQLGPQASLLENLFTIIFFAPCISVIVRRLHDTNRSGYKALLTFGAMAAIFGIGFLGGKLQNSALIAVFMILGYAFIITSIFILTKPSAPHTNKYGPNPLEVTS